MRCLGAGRIVKGGSHQRQGCRLPLRGQLLLQCRHLLWRQFRHGAGKPQRIGSLALAGCLRQREGLADGVDYGKQAVEHSGTCIEQEDVQLAFHSGAGSQ